MLRLYILQSLYMFVFGVIIIAIFAFWFTSNTTSAVYCIMAFILGLIITAINAFLCLKLSTCANFKLIVRVYEEHQSASKFGFMTGSIISLIGISLIILGLSTFFYFIH